MNANIVFSQQIRFNRALGVYGDLYVHAKKPIVDRAIVVVKSTQESTVARGKPYVAFIAGNEAFHGDEFAHSHFFAEAADAVAFCQEQLATHPAIVR